MSPWDSARDRSRVAASGTCTSDGLSDLVDVETMEELLNKSDEPTRIAKSLWAAAMNASGHDNITIALVERVLGQDI